MIDSYRKVMKIVYFAVSISASRKKVVKWENDNRDLF